MLHNFRSMHDHFACWWKKKTIFQMLSSSIEICYYSFVDDVHQLFECVSMTRSEFLFPESWGQRRVKMLLLWFDRWCSSIILVRVNNPMEFLLPEGWGQRRVNIAPLWFNRWHSSNVWARINDPMGALIARMLRTTQSENIAIKTWWWSNWVGTAEKIEVKARCVV